MASWDTKKHPRWPRGSKPPPPGAKGGRFMPRGMGAAAWAERVSDVIEVRRGQGGRERARGRDIRGELDYPAIQDRVGVDALLGRRGYGWRSVQDEALVHIYDLQGFHGRPEVLTEAEMDRRIADGWIEVWRGFGGPPGGIEYAEQFRTGGRHYAGLGVRANGTYTASGPDGAFQALTYTKEPPGGAGPVEPRALVRMAIPPDAQIADMLNMAYVHEIRGDYGVRDPARAARGRVLSDDGRLAAAMGYDGMAHVDDSGRGVYVIFNRSMLAVQEATPDG